METTFEYSKGHPDLRLNGKAREQEKLLEERMQGTVCPIYKKTATPHIFIDFKVAYGTVDREQLWQI